MCVNLTHTGGFLSAALLSFRADYLNSGSSKVVYPYAFGNWNELFKETTKLNTGFSAVVCLESTLK